MTLNAASSGDETLRNAAAQILELGLDVCPQGTERAFLQKLATTPQRLWSAEVTRAAYEALGGLSLITGDLPASNLPDGPSGQRIQVAWIEKEGEITISASYDLQVFAALRELSGSRYLTASKLWTVEDNAEVRAALTAADFHCEFADHLPSPPGGAEAEIHEHQVAARQVTYERSFHLRFEYDQGIVAEIKMLDRRRWDKAKGLWIVSGSPDQVHQLVEIIERHEFSVDEHAQRRIDSLMSSRKARKAEQSRVDALGRVQADHAEAALADIPLRAFQVRCVKATLRRRRVLIADQQGLGKTAEALAAIIAGEATPAIIVCPASLTLTWVGEAERWAPHLNSRVLTGTKPDLDQLSLNEGPLDLVILSYERLIGWAKTLADLKPQALVFDESHMIKESRSKRSKASLELARAVDNSALVMLLTGTPILNGPRELIHQLKVIDHLEAFGGAHGFRERYCNLHTTSFGQDDSGASNTQELGQKLRQLCMIRRRKEDVLKELPARLPPVSVPVDLAPADRKAYEEMTREVIAELLDDSAYKRRYAEEMATGTLRENAQRRAQLAGERARAAAAMVLMGRLRNETSRCKTPVAIKWAETFLQSGEKLIIFADSVRTQKALVEHFGERCIPITADIPPDERQGQADRFQEDPSVRVAVCSLRAASTGLTLTAASDVLMIDLPYTAGLLEQAIDRAHRIGQQNVVTPWLLLAVGTVDIQMGAMLARKLAVASEVIDGHSSTEETSVAGALLKALVEAAR